MTKVKSLQPIDKSDLPKGRKSIPPISAGGSFVGSYTGNKYQVVSQDYLREIIPIIRWLVYHNPDMGQALHNIMTLGNTGHKVFFDRGVSTDQVDKMRNHLANRKKEWASNQAGVNGLTNKMIAQLLVSGAISGEWVPKMDLSGINNFVFVNPEEIVFKLDRANTRYIPWQRPKVGYIPTSKSTNSGLIKLNQNTYKYFALNGDTELPFGVPPYLPVLNRIKSQESMEKNINFVVDQLGLLGFLETLIDKPDQEDDENDEDYEARLTKLLNDVKDKISGGITDGVVIGFKDDTEFNFHSIGKEFESVKSIYDNNELQIASSLKQDATLWGRAYSTSETQITVVFIKMLSELKNIQNIVGEMLEFGYALELRLAGFKFDYLKVVFNKSTIQDDLKYQQAREIKIRNSYSLYCDGIISLDQYADELDYEKPDLSAPRIPRTPDNSAGSEDPAAAAQKKTDRKKQKTASDKKTRQKNKPVNKLK